MYQKRNNTTQQGSILVGLLFVALLATGVQYVSKHKDIQSQAVSLYEKGISFLKTQLGSLTNEAAFLPKYNVGDIQDKVTSVTDSVSLPGPLSRFTSKEAAPLNGTLTIKGIIALTNKERQAQGASVLTEQTKLDASAQVKAEDILARQYFEHTAPDGRGATDLVQDQGYVYLRVGENLALGNFVDDADVVKAWMNSPGHRANILNTSFTEMGVGIAKGMYEGKEVLVAVQHFGTPRSVCPVISDSLKKIVEDGQKEITALESKLSTEKAAIEEGRSQGINVDDQVQIYNTGVDYYQKRFSDLNTLRLEYNTQVSAFNACLEK